MLGLNGLTPGSLLRISVVNLRVNWLRSLLTILGMVFGTGAVIATLSSNEGAKTFLQKELAKLGTNILTIATADTPQLLGEADAAAVTRYSPHVESAMVIRQVAGVSISHQSYVAKAEGVLGVAPNFFEGLRLPLAAGRLPNAFERREARLVVVLGWKVAATLFGKRYPIGEAVEMSAGQSRFAARVIGVIGEKGVSSGIDFDSLVYLSEGLARQFMTQEPRASLLVTLKSDKQTEAAKAQIQSVLRARFDEKQLRIYDAREAIERTQAIWQKQNLVGIALASVCLLTGGVGIMNVMTLSVLQRKREVGLRKAIGATDTAISSQFLLEAVVICILGGLVGVAVGWGFGQQVAKMLGDWEARMSLEAVGLAIGFATAVGIFFGLYPALRASKLAPYDALRG